MIDLIKKKNIGKNQPNNENLRSLGLAVGNCDVGMRLDEHLAACYPFLTRSGWQKRISAGKLLIDGQKVKPSFRLKYGNQVSMWSVAQAEPEVDKGIFPIWKQGGVMAVFKPGNLPMHENGPYRVNTLSHLIRDAYGEEWAAVHRLDRETSGIVLCGNSPAVRQALSRSLEQRRVSKEYIAICRGVPNWKSLLELGPIGDLEGSRIRIKKWVVANGLQAETEFRVLGVKNNYTLLHAAPKTGRTNQIRIHAAYNNLPLLGDKLFHEDEQVFIDYFEQGNVPSVVSRTGFPRHCLHAAKIGFVHPESGTYSTIECPMPSDMEAFWSQ